jgi:ferredoxin
MLTEVSAVTRSPHVTRVYCHQEGARMRVVVDLNRCLGYAQCVFLAPSVFKLNGEEALQYDPNPDDAMRQKVLRAAAACPVQAILVEHLSGKEGETTS